MTQSVRGNDEKGNLYLRWPKLEPSPVFVNSSPPIYSEFFLRDMTVRSEPVDEGVKSMFDLSDDLISEIKVRPRLDPFI